MVCFRVIGNDQVVLMASQAGQLELYVMTPIIVHVLLESTGLLTSSLRLLTERCVSGIQAKKERCQHYAETSGSLATALNPYIGYAAAAEVAKEALARGIPLRQVALEKGYLSTEQLDAILNLQAMTEPGIPGKPDLPRSQR